MPQNKILKIEKYLSQPLEMRYLLFQKMIGAMFEELRITNNENVIWELHPYAPLDFLPLNPIFLFCIDDFSKLPPLSVLMPIDGAIGLINFFEKEDPKLFPTLLAINNVLCSVVPEKWLKKVVFYDVISHKKVRKTKKTLIHGIINYDTFDEKELLKAIKNKKDYDLYLPPRRDFYVKGLELPASYPALKILGENLKEMNFLGCDDLNWPQESTDFFHIDKHLLLTSFDYVGMKLLKNNFSPKVVHKSKKNYTTVVNVSPEVSLGLLGDLDTSTSSLCSEINELSRFVKARDVNSFHGALIEKLKEKIDFKYFE